MSDSKSKDAILVDLGKQKRGRVKDLRKGKGRLMDDLDQTLADLRADGSIAEGAQPVIIVVERKRKKKGLKGMF